jgi:hypothetical protein
MPTDQIIQQIGLGAAAGLLGVAAIQAVRKSSHQTAMEGVAAGRDLSPTRVSGHSEELRAGSNPVSGAFKTAASTLRAYRYGATGLAVVAALHERPRVLVDGALVGLAIWAADRAGWLPGSESLTDQHLGGPGRSRTAMSLAQHVIFGIASVTAYRRLRRNLAA